jgi:hypothetical protein
MLEHREGSMKVMGQRNVVDYHVCCCGCPSDIESCTYARRQFNFRHNHFPIQTVNILHNAAGSGMECDKGKKIKRPLAISNGRHGRTCVCAYSSTGWRPGLRWHYPGSAIAWQVLRHRGQSICRHRILKRKTSTLVDVEIIRRPKDQVGFAVKELAREICTAGISGISA